ncbi:MAG: hypothetical protein MHMPM18_002352 [Marteilia pararefringens]
MVNRLQKPEVSSSDASASAITNNWFVIENQTTRPCQNCQNAKKCRSSKRSNHAKPQAVC